MIRYSMRAICSLAVALTLFAALPVRAADSDKYLPTDTDVVVTINVRQLLDSALVKKDALGALKDAFNNPDAKTALAALALDPLRDIESVVVAIPVKKDEVKIVTLINGRFDKARIHALAEKEAKDHTENLKIHKDVADPAGNKQTIYEINSADVPQTLFVGLVDKGPLVLTTGANGKAYLLETLAKSAPDSKSQLASKELQALLAKADPTQCVRIVALGDSLARMVDDPQIKPLLEKLGAVNGGVTVTGDIKLEVLLLAKNAEGARELANFVKDNLNKGLGLLAILASDNKQLGPVVELLKSIKTTSKDNVVIIKGEVSADLIEQSLKKDK